MYTEIQILSRIVVYTLAFAVRNRITIISFGKYHFGTPEAFYSNLQITRRAFLSTDNNVPINNK